MLEENRFLFSTKKKKTFRHINEYSLIGISLSFLEGISRCIYLKENRNHLMRKLSQKKCGQCVYAFRIKIGISLK